jgi:acyl-CoA thioesterase
MPAEFELDRHIGVEQVAPGRYAAELDEGWSIGGALNGGYLLAVIGNAIAAHRPGKPHPVAVSATYLGPGVPGPATVEVTTKRDGGRFSTVAAELLQDGRPKITVLATYGDLTALPDDVRTTAEPPEMPPVEECVGDEEATPDLKDVIRIIERLDRRFPADDVGWARGEPSGKASMACWLRMADDRPIDPLALLMVVDTLPPVTFALGMPGWAPTLELTVHVRAHPAPGWLKVRHETRNLAGGMFEEDCEVWDSAGRLVAQSRQLALAPRPA